MKKKYRRISIATLIIGILILFVGIYSRAAYLSQRTRDLSAMLEALANGTATSQQKLLSALYQGFWAMFVVGTLITLCGLSLHIACRVISNKRYPQNDGSSFKEIFLSRSFREETLEYIGDYMMFVIIVILMIAMSFAFPRFLQHQILGIYSIR